MFSTIFARERSQIPEYEFFSLLKYDVVTLGNHEYDLGDKGVEDMISAWGNSNPYLINSHYKSDIMDLRKSIMIEKDGIKMGILVPWVSMRLISADLEEKTIVSTERKMIRIEIPMVSSKRLLEKRE